MPPQLTHTRDVCETTTITLGGGGRGQDPSWRMGPGHWTLESPVGWLVAPEAHACPPVQRSGSSRGWEPAAHTVLAQTGVKRKGRAARQKGVPGIVRRDWVCSVGTDPTAYASLRSFEMLGPSCGRKHLA